MKSGEAKEKTVKKKDCLSFGEAVFNEVYSL
jgi:hypothetical protein